MASSDHADREGEPWLARWWRARWPAIVVTASALLGVALIIAGPLSEDGAQDVQGVPGKSFADVDGLAAPADVVGYTTWDFRLMFLVTISLVGLMSLRSLNGLPTQISAFFNRRRWWPVRYVPSSVRWKTLGGAATVVYLAADLLETWLLRRILTDHAADGVVDPSDADYFWFDDEIHALAWLHDVKWLSLAVAVLVTVSLLGRRTPTRPGTERDAHGVPCDWHGPDHRPGDSSTRCSDAESASTEPDAENSAGADGTAPADDDPPRTWEPAVGRLGISVSGGGIRSASFALGAFEVLRREGMLARADYVCSVSGGTYATAALEHANRTDEPPEMVLSRLRRRLNYLLTDTAKTLSSLLRVIFGLALNLIILYLVIFVVARPVGWLIGSPMFQEGLRYNGPVVVDVVGFSDDPDGVDTWEAADGCALGERPDAPPTLSLSPTPSSPVPAGEDDVTRVEFDITVPTQCVEIEPPDERASPPAGDRRIEVDNAVEWDRRYWQLDVGQSATGVLEIENGVATIVRQPELDAGRLRVVHPLEALPAQTRSTIEAAVQSVFGLPSTTSYPADDLVVVGLADLEVSGLAETAVQPRSDAELAELFETPGPVTVAPVNPLDLRAGIDVDAHDRWIPIVIALLAIAAYALTAVGWVVKRRRNVPRGVGRIYQLPSPLTALAVAALALYLVLPWLADELPKLIFSGVTGGPPEALTASLPWLPAGLPPIIAWLVLSGAAILQLRRQLRPEPKPDSKPRKRNSVALLGKIGGFVTKVLVGLILVTLFLATAVGVIATGAMNGPFGKGGWTSEDIPVLGWFRGWPDLTLWVGVGILLLVTRTLFQANTWSLAPIYRNGLRWAFMDDDVEHGSLDGRPLDDSGHPADARAGYLAGTNAELVICCAANIAGPDRAPTGRNAVSFTASRSYIGGPELGWMATDEYLDRLAPARAADLSIPSLTAVSGAAASPAMGKKSLGPIGSVLAILNVRLGGWLPHPQAVRNMSGELDSWKHTPGWTYFVREVLRRYKHESSYVYVSDGGHWENLGIVEALRRGCDHVIAISAAGDGVYSHGTLAEAVEIARTDLDIDIVIESVWKMRPTAGGNPASTLPSGRQFVRQDGDFPELGRVSPVGYAFGTFTRNGLDDDHAARSGKIVLIEATMVDGLPHDVHAYAEDHAEFPDVSTGDQFFTDRDFEAYRMLGVTVADAALDTGEGVAFRLSSGDDDPT